MATPAELTVRNLFGKQAPKPKPATGKTYRGKAGDNFDEFNRQSGAAMGKVRVPPSGAEIETFFTCWQHSIPQARKYLPAARDYFAASLWRRLGLRINETVMLDIRDWRPDLGGFGKFHVRFGKGARGRGPTPRLVPAHPAGAALLRLWLHLACPGPETDLAWCGLMRGPRCDRIDGFGGPFSGTGGPALAGGLDGWGCVGEINAGEAGDFVGLPS